MLGIIIWLGALLVLFTLLILVIGVAPFPAAVAILAFHIAFHVAGWLSRRIQAAAHPLREWRAIDDSTYETEVDGVICRARHRPGIGPPWTIDALAPERSAGERERIERKAASDWSRQPMAKAPLQPGRLMSRRRGFRFVTGVAAAGLATALAVLFLGPLWSGALFLLLPGHAAGRDRNSGVMAAPSHRGYVDLSSGIYVREDDDLVLGGAPPIALRRKYLSGYHVSRQFGIGATHDGEWYLIGDGREFRWAALILADGARIEFERTSAGLSLATAMFEHRATPSEFLHARLGWVGFGWAMRLDDGRLELFRGCGPGKQDVCGRTQSRDADGHRAYFARDAGGRLARMEASGRWIAFDYDASNRITRARDSQYRAVRYSYDDRGRLASAEASDGTLRLYTYTDRDEMQRISEPGRTVENGYDADGRVIRQVTWTAESQPYVFSFSYRAEGGAVAQTEVSESDGTWRRLTFRKRYPISESYRHGDAPPATFEYRRDPGTNGITAVSVSCTDRHGRPVTRFSPVTTGDVEWIKRDLVQTGCAFSAWQVPH